MLLNVSQAGTGVGQSSAHAEGGIGAVPEAGVTERCSSGGSAAIQGIAEGSTPGPGMRRPQTGSGLPRSSEQDESEQGGDSQQERQQGAGAEVQWAAGNLSVCLLDWLESLQLMDQRRGE